MKTPIRIDIRLAGDKNLIRDLEALPKRMRTTFARKAVTAAVRPIVSSFKANMPVKSGSLRRAAQSKIKVYSRSGNVVGIIGARSDMVVIVKDRFGKSRRVKPSKYLHLVEFGTKAHLAKLGDVEFMHPGTRGLAPLRRAYEANKAAAIVTMATSLRESLNSVG